MRRRILDFRRDGGTALTVADIGAATLYKFMAQLDASIPQKLLKVRRLEAHDVTSYRELRLEGLKSHPGALSSSWDDAAANPPASRVRRLAANTCLARRSASSP